jgi:hypothetical protein
VFSRPQFVARFVRRVAPLAGLIALALAGGASFASAAPDLPPNTLFALERSLNANIVVYEANLNGDGSFASKSPVQVYWIRLADDGRREELNFIEKSKAYGVDVTPEKETGALTMSIRSLPKRPMRIIREEGKAVAVLPVCGQEAILKKVFVKSKKGGLMPGVEYVDLFGVTREGAEVTERIVP